MRAEIRLSSIKSKSSTQMHVRCIPRLSNPTFSASTGLHQRFGHAREPLKLAVVVGSRVKESVERAAGRKRRTFGPCRRRLYGDSAGNKRRGDFELGRPRFVALVYLFGRGHAAAAAADVTAAVVFSWACCCASW